MSKEDIIPRHQNRQAEESQGGDVATSGVKRSSNDAGLSGDTTLATAPLEASAPTFNNDYYLQSHRNEDLHLSEGGKVVNEESFCSNFVCCGVHLADLHALLQHYEDVHVKVQNTPSGPDEDEDEVKDEESGENDVELDVVGDGNGRPLAKVAQRHEKLKRTDSVLSSHSFGSAAAADALLGVGVASNYQMPSYGHAENMGMPQHMPPGYYYPPPPPPHYYMPQQQQHGGRNGGERPVSAFDTTILRTVSPAMAAVQGYGAPPPSYPGYYPNGPYYAPYYPPHAAPHMYGHPVQGGAPQMSMPYPYGMPQAMPPQSEKPFAKKQRTSVPNMRAVHAASSSLRETLPVALGADQSDPNQFKLIYSILSNTLTPSSDSLSYSGSSSKEQEAMDKATLAKNTAAAILAMPRPPVDKSLERPYICPVPGCGKAYKNPNGLKYHALHGHDGTNELVERPYRCPYGDCGKRYKNPNGLKYHVNKNHADMLPKSALLARSTQQKLRSSDGEEDDSDVHDQSEHEGDSDEHDHSDGEEEIGGESSKEPLSQ